MKLHYRHEKKSYCIDYFYPASNLMGNYRIKKQWVNICDQFTFHEYYIEKCYNIFGFKHWILVISENPLRSFEDAEKILFKITGFNGA